MVGAAGHEPDLLAHFQSAVDDPNVSDHPLVVVELGVEDQRPQRRRRIARGRRHALDDRPEYVGHALAGLGADGQDLGRVDAQRMHDLFLDLFGPGGLHVDLVQHRHDRQVVAHGQEGVGHGLGLHSLGRIDQQDRPFAGGQAARNLVMKVDVAGSVDQVQFVHLAVERVIDRHGPGLDGDPALALEIHVVEQLLAKLALGDRAGLEQQLVGQRALAVVDVGDDREITDILGIKGHATSPVALEKPSGRSDGLRKNNRDGSSSGE